MRAIRKSFRARLREPGGFSLPELIIAASMVLIIATAGLALLLTGQRQQIRQEFRTTSLDDARDAMTRMAREVREAAAIEAPLAGQTGAVLDVRLPVASSGGDELRLVRYDCSGTSDLGPDLNTCTRAEETGPGTGMLGSPVLMLDGVANENVFAVGTGSQARTVTITIEERVVTTDTKSGGGFEESSDPVVLSETVSIRNCTDDNLNLAPCA
jgi:prepilin-type N-terminal cleavage/methylation domain-containing protein